MTFSKKLPISVLIVAVSALVIEIVFLIYGPSHFNSVEIFPKPDLNLSQDHLLNAVKNDFSLVDSTQNLSYDIKPEILQAWLTTSYRDFFGQRRYVVDEEKVKESLIGMPITIATQPSNGKLAIDENSNLVESIPSGKGLVLNVEETVSNIASALRAGRNWTEIKFNNIEPKISLEKARSLGIKTLLARGQSNFDGSTKTRAQNIAVGAAVYNGLVIKPGEEFSFNNLLGTVDASTGYVPELIVKNHEISKEYGGGLCQVSTTVFRAATIAGLPITERHNHSLALHYYSPQGFDATIYPGVSDLRFVNDTPGNILIQTEIDGTYLYFDLFGVNDGRQITIDGPHTLSATPDGAMKTILRRTITYADGMVKNDSFYSIFSPAALYPMAKNPLE